MQLFTELLNACWFSWGNFILAGCIDVDSSPLIYSELARAQDNLVLANELHLLYLVTPHDLRDSPQPEWMVYYKQVSGNSFWFSIESIIRLQYTLFDWLKYRAPPSQPIKCKTNGNRDLVGRVFPRWTQVTCVNFEFSLVPLDITLSSSWPFVITLVFPFRRAISKIALVEFYPLVVEIIKKKKNCLFVMKNVMFNAYPKHLWNPVPEKKNESKVTCLEEFYRRLTVVVVSPSGIFISRRVRGKSRWTFGSNRKFFIQKSHRTAIENGKWSSYWIVQGSWVRITFYFISLTSILV